MEERDQERTLRRMEQWTREALGYDAGRGFSPRRSDHAPNPPGPVIDLHHLRAAMDRFCEVCGTVDCSTPEIVDWAQPAPTAGEREEGDDE